MTNHKQHLVPPSVPAFTYALLLIHRRLKNAPRIPLHYIPPSSSPSPSLPPTPPPRPLPSPKPHFALPVVPRPRPTVHFSPATHAAIASLHTSHVQSLLLRCQILDVTIKSFAYVRSGRTQRGLQKRWCCIEELQVVAREVFRLVGEGEDGGLRREARWWGGVAEGWEEGGVRLEGREGGGGGGGGGRGGRGGGVGGEGDPYAVYEVLPSEAEEGASSDGDVETEEGMGWRFFGEEDGEEDEEVEWSPGEDNSEEDEEVEWSPGPSPISSSGPSLASSPTSSPFNHSTRGETENHDADEGDSLWDEPVETRRRRSREATLRALERSSIQNHS